MDTPFLTADEVSLLLRKSSKWVYQRATEIPGSFKLGGSWFFDREILLAELKDKASKPTREAVKRNVPTNRHGLL